MVRELQAAGRCNDLSLLLHCDVMGAPRGRQGPLRFVGLEANPFRVAKSLVVAEMLRRGTGGRFKEIPIQHCLQAWYSRGWSAKASANFKACAAAVASRPDAGSTNKAVQSYLLHWASAPDVPLPEARHRWLKSRGGVGRGSSEIAQFKGHKDRMAVCAYMLTGDVLGEGQRAEVGSLAMWSVPERSPPLEDGENVLQAVDINALAERGPKGDVMAVVAALLSEQLLKVRGWLVEGALEVEVRCEFVSLGAPVVKEIQALRPYTMSWSNILDYMPHRDFHRLARDCSVHGDTVHCGCSMNWITEVFGACIVDFTDLKVRTKLMDAANESMARFNALLPSSRLLVHPPFETTLNTTGFGLASMHSGAWGKHFFKREFTGGDVQVGECDPHPYNPLARSYCTMAMTWTYDTSVRMTPNSA